MIIIEEIFIVGSELALKIADENPIFSDNNRNPENLGDCAVSGQENVNVQPVDALHVLYWIVVVAVHEEAGCLLGP